MFLLCALVPIVVLFVITDTHVSASLGTAGAEAMRERAKDLGMGVMDRLRVVEAELRTRATLPPQAVRAARPRQDDADPLMWVSRATRLAPNVADGGTPAPAPPPIDAAQQQHLASRGALLFADARDGGNGQRITMLVAAPDAAGDTVLVWGEIAPSFLWSGMQRERPEDGSCVFAANGRMKLHCIGYLEAHKVTASEFGEGAFARPIGGIATIGARWGLFLRFQYGAPSWVILVTEAEHRSLAPLERFRVTSLLVSAFTLVTVFFLSLVWIRRSTVPLVRLHAGTKRVAAGDFSSPVDVTTDDEFGEVARAFNGMASDLDRQLTGLKAMDAIDHAAMSTRIARELVGEAMRAVHDATARPIVIALVPLQGFGAWNVWSVAPNGGLGARTVDPNAADLFAMRHASPHHVLRAASRAPSALWDIPAARDAVLMSLEHGGTLLGGLAFELPRDEVPAEALLEDMRRIADRVALALSTVRTLEHLDALSLGTLTAFARAIDANSPWTAGHSERVTRLALVVGQQMGLTPRLMETLQRGGLLHDIGKIGVPASILDKPSKLSDEEFAVMRSHAVLGARILAPIDAFADVIPIVRHHHERVDGNGYPDRLIGQSIPLLARVLAVADVYDALVSVRPYRAGWSHDDAMQHLRANAGSQFDPICVKAFEAAVASGEVAAVLAAADGGESAQLAEDLMAGRALIGAVA